MGRANNLVSSSKGTALGCDGRCSCHMHAYLVQTQSILLKKSWYGRGRRRGLGSQLRLQPSNPLLCSLSPHGQTVQEAPFNIAEADSAQHVMRSRDLNPSTKIRRLHVWGQWRSRDGRGNHACAFYKCSTGRNTRIHPRGRELARSKPAQSECISSRKQETLDLKCAFVTEILFARVCAFLRRFARFLWGIARVILGWHNAS